MSYIVCHIVLIATYFQHCQFCSFCNYCKTKRDESLQVESTNIHHTSIASASNIFWDDKNMFTRTLITWYEGKCYYNNIFLTCGENSPLFIPAPFCISDFQLIVVRKLGRLSGIRPRQSFSTFRGCLCACVCLPSPPMPTGQCSRMLLLVTVKQSIHKRRIC